MIYHNKREEKNQNCFLYSISGGRQLCLFYNQGFFAYKRVKKGMTDEANAIEKSAPTSCHFYLSPFIYVFPASSGSSFSESR